MLTELVASSIADLRARFALVRGLSFIAHSAATAKTGWAGYGHAVVEVTAPQPDVLVFHENGHWQQAGGGLMAFSNVFRWTFLTDRVCLEHLRFGQEQPVELFDLVPSGESSWESSEPHVCRDDCYRGRLLLIGPDIHFEWTVTGPKKNESIRYVYR